MIILTLLSLFLTACSQTQEPASEHHDEVPSVGPIVQFQVETPVDGLDTLPVVNGSYCFGEESIVSCVDTVMPNILSEGVESYELYELWEDTYVHVLSREGELKSIEAKLLNPDGESLNCAVNTTLGGSELFPEVDGFVTLYSEACEVHAPESFILEVFVTFEEGGDAIYYVPLKWKED